MSEDKWIWIVAGPPGAGKTSLAARLFPDWIGTSRHIDADDTKGFDDGDDLPPGLFHRIVPVSKRLQIAEVGKRSFVVETRMMNRKPLIAAQRLRRRGWHLAFVYLALPRLDLCRVRIGARINMGGGDVAPGHLERGFNAALSELPKYLDIADRWLVLDSSGRRRPLIAHGVRYYAAASQADALRALAPRYPFRQALPSHRDAPWADNVTAEFVRLAQTHGLLSHLRTVADDVERRTLG